ncbi:MAG: Hsp20/alpha crystallin family protein [Treponemataceae bacterium]|jgi:HSP20 family protein|uniref:Hsp20/alpha crystallin family protein n=1 Tax=Treponema sp. J25 TaxID=2094121 RepID=UPI0010538FDE|nr:Hsp20/alpha crystallin family protein [Treponema sp. J25]MCX7948543.1 Hsp20/alpha crystallin family protein [Treponemataceae bacterium]HOJ99450.1 Hsp20/alpha crystallin family protein [Termitinemataceae bacterium]TCW62176.1 Hsp20/alpha crystallin family protein [Treponema sp. J25]HOM23315.1 Hsp20/alpha crystallin family protein [Termitinemataceae bacterium]HPQ00519.1 Hsp20/alpha crystallin family protein [Termitinemataceae bacterium]
MNLIPRRRNYELDPIEELEQLQQLMNRWFDSGWDNMGLLDRAVAPAMDLVETPDAYYLYVDLPGIDKKDISLTVENNVLTLEGEKKGKDEKKRFFRKETWEGSFRRTISLPNAADPEKVKAELKNGVLTVTIGKKEELKPRQIAVQVK